MLTYKEFTEPGNREINEDSIGVCQTDAGICCVLCDGLGGHGRGEEASKLVVDSILDSYKNTENAIDHIDEFFENAQKELLGEQKKKNAKFEMKTTATILVIDSESICWGHIGDSRIYMFKKGKYKMRSIDHSVPQMLVMARDIKEKEIRNHPDRNKLLRVMGIEWGSGKYVISKKIKRKDNLAFLLCSDGFWELIEEKEMSDILRKSSDAEAWVNSMAEIVKKNGADKNMDNFSAIAVIL